MKNHGKNDTSLSHLLDMLNQAREIHDADIPMGGRTPSSSIQLRSTLSQFPSSVFGGGNKGNVHHCVKQQPQSSSSSQPEPLQLFQYPLLVSMPASLPFTGDAGSVTARTAPAVPAKPPKFLAKKRTWKKPKGKPKRPLSACEFFACGTCFISLLLCPALLDFACLSHLFFAIGAHLNIELPTITSPNNHHFQLSIDNLFFQSERQKLVSQGENSDSQQSSFTQMPVAAPINSFSISKVLKRPHRKAHGKIGFAALARNVASKWKGLDAPSRVPFNERAAVEKARYRTELETWKCSQKEKERSDQAAQQQEQKESNEYGQDGGRVPKDEPLQDQDQEKSSEALAGQSRECQSPRKKQKLISEPKEKMERGMEGTVVILGVSLPQTTKQKKISEKVVVISRLEAVKDRVMTPVNQNGPQPRTTTRPPPCTSSNLLMPLTSILSPSASSPL